MRINKKLAIITGFSAVIALSIAASAPQERQPPKLVNLKVFPKNIPYRVLDHTMDVWAESLGVHCNFCHARDAQTNKMDFASDAKPEKTTARRMFQMTAKINKKFFKAEKDSLGMVTFSSVACNTCHHGTAHPEVKMPERQRGPGPGGPPPAGTPPPPPPGNK
ncbi:MAG TPA: c-type cytochrome [Mucilaginibacter sp.]|nr:c-type cytochrome [Mucilaginibacter sp.]